MFTIAPAYPADAIGGCDFLSGSGQRTILDIGPGGELVRRLESIIVGERFIRDTDLLDGRPCLSEQTIRSIGGELGLYDATVVIKLKDQLEEARERLRELAAENEALRTALAAIEQIKPYPRDALLFGPAEQIEPVRPLEEVTP